MFVHAPRLRTQGVAVTTLAMFSLVGCDDPIASTDLRPEGDPEVLSVLVMNDSVDFFFETATFCAVNDAKRPGFVGTPFGPTVLCPDDLSMGTEPVSDATSGGAEPTSWYVRIMFDELLDPTVEDLIPVLDPDTMMETGLFTGSLATTQPVILNCGGVAIEYDGYYSPSGNNVTWPVGPSLFIQPTDPTTVATGSTCTVEIKDSVVDKTGNPVPAAQRTGVTWDIASLAFLQSSPAPGGKVCSSDATESCGDETDCTTAGDTCNVDLTDVPEITADAPVVVTFNGFIDAATLDAAEVTISEQDDCATTAGAVTRTAVVVPDPADPLSLDISIAGAAVACPGAMAGDPDVACAFTPAKSYVITFTPDNAVTDLAGGPGALPPAESFSLCIDAIAVP
jgi:hypothetical protein